MTDQSPDSGNGSAPPVVIPAVLQPYADQERWVVWGYEVRDGKRTKPPFQARDPSRYARNDDPSTWAPAAEALDTYHQHKDRLEGIGIELRDSDLVVFDLDNCIGPTGILHPLARRIVDRAQTYVEVTPSNKGLRIIGTGTGPRVHRQFKSIDGEFGCECYRQAARFITVTGRVFEDTPQVLANLDAVMDQVVAELDALKNQTSEESEEEDRDSEGNAELPPSLIGLLYIPNLGAGQPHAGYATRSELTFAFITTALRARISGKTITAACLDETYRGCAIFEHCKQNGGRRYVLKQGKNARTKLKEALNAEIVEINKAHALVLAGNQASVMKFEMIGGKDQFRLLQVGAFKIWFANQHVTVGKKVTPLGDFWISHEDRREYHGIEFEPTRRRAEYYNMWHGFAVEPREGDCSKFLGHLKDNIAKGNEDHYRWVVGWFAQIFQQLDTKMGTSLCLRGKQGVGKTKVGEVIGALLGNHYELVSDPRYIVGQFNSHMAGLLLLHADEAFWAGDKRSEGKLKDLVTGHRHRLEFKGVDPISVRNLIRLFVTGNQEWLVPAGFGERRFAVFDVGEGKIKNNDYFAAIDAEMNNGGREALLHHLLNFDLSQINLRVIPNTEALMEQIVESILAGAGMVARYSHPWRAAMWHQ